MNGQPLRIERDRVAFLVVDVQQRLAAAMDPDAMERMERRVVALVEGAKVLGIPLLVTEQYPQGIGPTVPMIRSALPEEAKPLEKLDFSCFAAPEVRGALEALGRNQLVLAGMETHICIFQTARDLAAAGYQVFVPWDAVISRVEENRRVGLELAARAGAVVTTTETVLFDLLARAGSPEFKAVSRLIK
ncbi:isochorismatase family protein [Vulgatibacter sp.]|uniref:isochorismatase family protein n=1 Tax=Vulgatibacter sp. TaxID=1971226 RepID=UPI0035655EF1